MGTDEPTHRYAGAIRARGLTIYDPVAVGDPELWIPLHDLESILRSALQGRDLGGLPLRTRSKVAKELVCRALGYPTPKSFRKTRPRFPGQLFDTYVQKSDNLQIWNEAIDPSRRYVLIRLGPDDTVASVRVVAGTDIAVMDTTGTLTTKYQARMLESDGNAELATPIDTGRVRSLLSEGSHSPPPTFPTSDPAPGSLLAIADLFESLRGLVGTAISDAADAQERVTNLCVVAGRDFFDKFPAMKGMTINRKLQIRLPKNFFGA